MAEEFDLVILGGGTGGYVAAIRASQLGLKTAIVEKEKLGGTCLHKGCIPSKALLRSAEVFQTVKNSNDYGIHSAEVTLDFSKVQSRKDQIVTKLHQGVQYLMNKGKITVYEGYGRLLGPSIFSPLPGTVSVELNNGEENEILIPKNVILATGSRPKPLAGLPVDGEKVLTSDEALELETLPKSIIIIGGGVIGIEWASMLHDFGVKVTVLEYSSQILPTEDEEVVAEMTKLLRNKGIEIVTGAKVSPEACELGETQLIRAEINGTLQEFVAEKVLVSVGREANISGIGIENTDIEIKNGHIATNQYYQTKESHIYAIGDCIGGLQLAHVAAREGCLAVEHLAEKNLYTLDYSAVPKCIYSSPEMASVGLTEVEAKNQGYEVKVGKFPLQAIGKSLVYGETEGFAKIIADAKTNDLLGIHLIGAHATEMISEAVIAKILDATPWEISLAIHPHPSLSEVIGEAALGIEGLSLHL